jgi:hypothetical protein
MKSRRIVTSRRRMFELIQQAIDKQCWIKNSEGPEWYTPDELYAIAKQSLGFGINIDKDTYSVAGSSPLLVVS